MQIARSRSASNGMNLNKVFIVGRVTANPELRTTVGGHSVTSFSLATNRAWTGKDGGKQEETEFHNIVAWGRQAEIAAQFLTKGSLAMIEGRLRTRAWQDKQGENRKTTEIICERLQLGPRPAGQSFQAAARPMSAATGGLAPKTEAVIEDIPIINVEEEAKAEDLPF